MKVVAFTKYDRLAASTRQRILQYIPHLTQAGIDVEVHPLLGNSYVRSLVTGQSYPKAAIARAYLHRMRDLLSGDRWDAIWVYAELFPYLPATFEKIVFRRGRPVVYEFDDAFFHQYDDSSSRLVRLGLGGKLKPLLSRAHICICGNAYLRDYATRFNQNVIVIPTVVDADIFRPRGMNVARPITIGWIGSPSNWPYVRPLLSVIEAVCRETGAIFSVVGAGLAANADRFTQMQTRPWREECEVVDLQEMDIGIMPLPDEDWARGKSGYKLVQYMACGLPVIASPVGANRDIVVDGSSGILASSLDEWRLALEELVNDADLRRRIGAEGRRRAVQAYSLAAHAPRLVEVFRQVTAKGDRRGG